MTISQLNIIINTALPTIGLETINLVKPVSRAIKNHFPELVSDDNIVFVIKEMKDKKLIEVENDGGYGFTGMPQGNIATFGIQVNDGGGWLKYLEGVSEERSIDKEIKTLTLEQIKLTIQHTEISILQIKNWWLIALLGAFLGKAIEYLILGIVKIAERL
jgi:hypothetical protein